MKQDTRTPCERFIAELDQKIIEAFAMKPEDLMGDPVNASGIVVMSINKAKAEKLLNEVRTRLKRT